MWCNVFQESRPPVQHSDSPNINGIGERKWREACGRWLGQAAAAVKPRTVVSVTALRQLVEKGPSEGTLLWQHQLAAY